MKKTVRLTESDLKQIVKESVSKIINEIGDTPKGQKALGALGMRHALRNPKYDARDSKSKEAKIYDYAKKARGGDTYDYKGTPQNPKYYDYANGAIDYMNSHTDELAAAHRRARIGEMKESAKNRLAEGDLHRIVKESVNRVLNEIGDTPKGQYMLGRLYQRSSSIGSKPNKYAWYDAFKKAEKMNNGKPSESFAQGDRDEYLKDRRIDTKMGTFKLERGEDELYAVSTTDNDFYYTLPKEMEFAPYVEIQNYLNDIAENEI